MSRPASGTSASTTSSATTVAAGSLFGITDPTSGPDAQAALAFLQSAACQTQVAAAGNDVDAGCSANDTALFTAVAMLRNDAATGGLAALQRQLRADPRRWRTRTTWSARRTIRCTVHVNRPVNQQTGRRFMAGNSAASTSSATPASASWRTTRSCKGDVGFDNAGDPSVDPVRPARPERHRQRGADVREVRHFGAPGLQLARRVPDQTNQQGSNRNPYYVEAYDQIDLSVSYEFNDSLSLGFEAINLTGEDVRWHGRSDKQRGQAGGPEPALPDRGPLQVLTPVRLRIRRPLHSGLFLFARVKGQAPLDASRSGTCCRLIVAEAAGRPDDQSTYMLNNVTHKDLRVITRFGASSATTSAACSRFRPNTAEVQREYPIFFRKDRASGDVSRSRCWVSSRTRTCS